MQAAALEEAQAHLLPGSRYSVLGRAVLSLSFLVYKMDFMQNR